MRRDVWVVSALLWLGAVAMTAAAQSPDPVSDAAVWLDRAGHWVQQINNPEDPTDAAHDRADALYQLILAEAAADRPDRAAQHVGALRAAVAVIVVGAGDPWPNAYLPGALTAMGREAEARVTRGVLADAPTRLDAAQMTAEALLWTGDAAGYAAAVDRMWALLPQVQAAKLAEAEANPAWAFDGTFTGWYILRMFRDHGDLDGARRFAGFDWRDPAEAAGVQAILSQLESWKGEAARARAAADRARAKLAEAGARHEASPEVYLPDLDTHLPEWVAALWLLDGRAPAMEAGQSLALPETIWREAAAAHAATMLRRTGKADDARAAIDEALARAFLPGEEPMTWDVMHLMRELARQGRADDAGDYLDRSEDAAFRAFGSVGVAQGLLWPDQGE